MVKNKILNYVLHVSMIVFAACLYAFFFKVTVEDRGFLAMGASGIAVIISRLIGGALDKGSLVSTLYMIFYILINIPLLILGSTKISKKFILSTLLFVVVYSVFIGFLPDDLGAKTGFDKLDDLTAAILIGLIAGVSSAITLFAGGCAGGGDILATYLNVKKGKGIGVYSLILNASVLLIGLIVFKDVVSIIYTLVYAFVSSIVLDHYYTRSKKIMLEIITNKKEEICNCILENSHHGCTILPAVGAYTSEEKQVIHAVVSWSQLKSLTKAIRSIDENCFIIDLYVYNVNGDFYIPPIK